MTDFQFYKHFSLPPDVMPTLPLTSFLNCGLFKSVPLLVHSTNRSDYITENDKLSSSVVKSIQLFDPGRFVY